MVLAIIMSVPENVWDVSNVTVPVPATYTSVTEVTSWLLLCTSDAFYTLI